MSEDGDYTVEVTYIDGTEGFFNATFWQLSETALEVDLEGVVDNGSVVDIYDYIPMSQIRKVRIRVKESND